MSRDFLVGYKHHGQESLRSRLVVRRPGAPILRGAAVFYGDFDWIQDRCDAGCLAVKLGQLPRCARVPLAASQPLCLLGRLAGFGRSESSADHLEVTMNYDWQKRSGVPVGRKGR